MLVYWWQMDCKNNKEVKREKNKYSGQVNEKKRICSQNLVVTASLSLNVAFHPNKRFQFQIILTDKICLCLIVANIQGSSCSPPSLFEWKIENKVFLLVKWTLRKEWMIIFSYFLRVCGIFGTNPRNIRYWIHM